MSPTTYIIVGLLFLAAALMSRRPHDDESGYHWPVNDDEQHSPASYVHHLRPRPTRRRLLTLSGSTDLPEAARRRTPGSTPKPDTGGDDPPAPAGPTDDAPVPR